MSTLAEVEPRTSAFDRWFEPTIWVAIVLNAAVTVWAFSDHEREWLIEPLHQGFGWFFTVEIVVRLAQVGFNPKVFVKDPWNVFDTVLVVLCQLPVLGATVMGARLVQVVRAARVFHSVRHLSTLRLARIVRLFES